jgi:hypothetical protein
MDKKATYDYLKKIVPKNAAKISFEFYAYDEWDSYTVMDENDEEIDFVHDGIWNIVDEYLTDVLEHSQYATDEDGGCYGTITLDFEHFVTKLESTQRVTEVYEVNEDIF